MNVVRSVISHAVRSYCSLPIRGRHRIADRLGKYLAPELIVGAVRIPLDLTVPMYRYIAAGVYEDNNVRHWRKVLRPGDTFIDCGANIGYVAALAAEMVGRTGRVYAIEPSPTCLAKLRGYLNADNITLIEAAVADKDGTEPFCDTPRVIDCGYGALARIETPPDADIGSVRTVTIDGLIGRERVRYLKLDVEGAEMLALKGAETGIRERRITFIMTELTYSGYCIDIAQNVESFLGAFGYRPHEIDRHGDMRRVDLRRFAGGRVDAVWSV